MTTFLAGLFFSLSLIVAIGAQNAFILRQGLRREYIFPLCLLCAISDAILISFGVYGFAALAQKIAIIEPFARYGGAIFLLCYGALAFRRAWQGENTLIASDEEKTGIKKALLTCIAFTWLNPHAYLDTIVLLGSISANYGEERGLFACGAIIASFFFFFALGYGARLLTPFFRKPSSWRILDTIIGCVMWWIAGNLLLAT